MKLVMPSKLDIICTNCSYNLTLSSNCHLKHMINYSYKCAYNCSDFIVDYNNIQNVSKIAYSADCFFSQDSDNIILLSAVSDNNIVYLESYDIDKLKCEQLTKRMVNFVSPAYYQLSKSKGLLFNRRALEYSHILLEKEQKVRVSLDFHYKLLYKYVEKDLEVLKTQASKMLRMEKLKSFK